MVPASEAKSHITQDQQRAEVEAVLSSAPFLRAPRHSKLLSYLCEKYFQGHSKDVKEYTIATEVLGRGPDFDQGRDAIVRVEMHRLRKKLKDFYETEGASHAIEILINPGQYVPCFQPRGHACEATAPEQPANLIELPSAERLEPHTRSSVWREVLLATAVVLLCSAGLVALRRGAKPAVGTASAVTAQATTTGVLPAVGPDSDVRILCGFTKDRYIDREGNIWRPDAFFSGGYTLERPRQYFARTEDPAMYQTQRFGEFSYDIPAKPGKYELWLYFAETNFGPETTTGGGENSRVFNVRLNGKMLLEQFDIFSDAGGAKIADIRRFKNITPAADGKVHLQFERVRDNAMIDAIRLVPMKGDKQAPIRVVAQESTYTDSHGAVWMPDTYYYGGQFSTHKDAVRGTPDSDLYAGERYGNFSYAIPVDPHGSYTVNLYMSETYWGPNSPGKTGGVGTRVFDVYCNGVALLRNFDIYKEAGALQAVKKSFRGLQANAQGKLLLSFVPVANYASIYAIEVVED